MIKNRIAMKRDMDLIREILLAIESDVHGFAPKMEIHGYTQEQINYHAFLLGEAGLAKVVNVTSMGSESPEAFVTSLTWAGHEFLDSARENQRWNQAKDIINKIGGASSQILITLLTELTKKALDFNILTIPQPVVGLNSCFELVNMQNLIKVVKQRT